MELLINQERFENKDMDGATGIFIRAVTHEGKWENVDLCQLERESIIEWVNSCKNGAINALLILLGYDQIYD